MGFSSDSNANGDFIIHMVYDRDTNVVKVYAKKTGNTNDLINGATRINFIIARIRDSAL